MKKNKSKFLVLLLILSMFFVNTQQALAVSIPTITTGASSSVTKNTVTLSSEITNGGGGVNTAVGFEYGTTDSYGLVSTESGNFNSTFGYVLKFGSSGSGNGQFSDPMSIVVDSSGFIYVLDSGNSRVQKFDSSGNYISQFGSSGSGDGQFSNQTMGIAIDSSDNLFVVDQSNRRVQKFDSSGNYISQFGTQGSGNGEFDNPNSIAIDSSGNIYVSEGNNYRVQKFNSSGVYQLQFGSFGSGNGHFQFPSGVAVDSSGNIYVTDQTLNRVQKFDSSGNYISQFGSSGSGNGQFNYANRIFIDQNDNIFVLDTSSIALMFPSFTEISEANQRVQKFDSSGNYISQFGTYGSGDGQLKKSKGIFIDSSDNVYIADTYNNRVQKFTGTGQYTKNITGLTCGTQYHYRAYSTNSVGTGTGIDSTFTTNACPVISAVSSSNVTNSEATITWTTDQETSSIVEYGTTTNYGSTTAETDTSTRVLSHSVILSGLTACTTYNYRVKSNDSSLNLAVSSNGTFHTPGCAAVSVVLLQSLSDAMRSGTIAQPYTPITQPTTTTVLCQPNDLFNPNTGERCTTYTNNQTNNTNTKFTFNINLKYKDTNNDVKELQKFLNNNNFPVSTTGPGSLNNETTYFGPATLSAVIKYQKAKNITPSVGYFGPLTRASVNN